MFKSIQVALVALVFLTGSAVLSAQQKSIECVGGPHGVDSSSIFVCGPGPGSGHGNDLISEAADFPTIAAVWSIGGDGIGIGHGYSSGPGPGTGHGNLSAAGGVEVGNGCVSAQVSSGPGHGTGHGNSVRLDDRIGSKAEPSCPDVWGGDWFGMGTLSLGASFGGDGIGIDNYEL